MHYNTENKFSDWVLWNPISACWLFSFCFRILHHHGSLEQRRW